MKTLKIYLIAIMALTFALPNVNGQESQNNRPPKEKLELITLEGTVTNIVKETREITVMGVNGYLVTIVADEAVERFDEIAVNDVITVDYWTYMKAEFRKPTAEELAEPIVIIAEGIKAPEGSAPGAAVSAIVKAVVTIEALNRPLMLAIVQGPLGNFLTIEMEDQELITQLHIGQVIILTYQEIETISLTKVSE